MALLGIFLADSFSKTTAIFAKVLVGDGWTPVALYFLTLTMVGIFLAVHEVMSTERRRWFLIRSDLPGILLTTVLGGILSPLFFFAGLQYASASDAVLITSLSPLFIVCFAVLMLGERFTRPMVVGGALLLAGNAVLLWRDVMQAELHAGAGFLLAAVVAGALMTTVHKKYVRNRHLDTVVFVRTLLSWVVVGGWMALTEPESFSLLAAPQNIWLILGMSVVGFILPFFLYFRSLAHVSTMEAGVMVAAGPVVGVLMASGFLGEQITLHVLISLGLIVAGILSINVPLTKLRIMPSRPMELGPLRR